MSPIKKAFPLSKNTLLIWLGFRRSSTVSSFGFFQRTMVKVNIKPLSVNSCYTGRRFKNDAYKKYERLVLLMLPNIVIPEGNLKISFVFGLSSLSADWDNSVKICQDIISKKYGFNDKRIHEGHVIKKKVPKGDEYFEFEITSLD